MFHTETNPFQTLKAVCENLFLYWLCTTTWWCWTTNFLPQ